MAVVSMKVGHGNAIQLNIEGRRYYITLVKLIVLLAILTLFVQPLVYTPIHYAVARLWALTAPTTAIPAHIRLIVSVQNASSMLDADADAYREIEKPRKIPKIFHQIYSDDRIPDVYAPLIKSWVQNHPDYEYWLWDDVSGRLLVERHYPEFLALYDAYCHDLFRSDALRYFVLHRYGGVYFDMDYLSLKNMDELLQEKECILVQENAPQAALLYRVPDMVMNAWMASVPNHPYMHYVINMLPSHFSCYFHDVLSSTGPLYLYELRKKYIDQTRCNLFEGCFVHILPSELMMPQWDVEAVKHFVTTCKRRPLNALQVHSCRLLQRHKFSEQRPVPADAYATHLFMHLGNYAKKFKAVKRIGITDIVPYAIRPSEGKI